MSSVHVTEVADWLVLHYAQVVHGAAEGDLDSLANAGRASFHHFDFVYGLVHAQRNHLGSRKPLPEGVGVGGGGKVSIHYNTCTAARLKCFDSRSSKSKGKMSLFAQEIFLILKKELQIVSCKMAFMLIFVIFFHLR